MDSIELNNTQRLYIIRYLESNHCKYTNHNSDALGCYGIRPVTFKQLGLPLTANHDKVALQNLKYIQKVTNCFSEQCLAYGWLFGPYKLLKVLKDFKYGNFPYRNPLIDNWYVKKYMKKRLKLLNFSEDLRISFFSMPRIPGLP